MSNILLNVYSVKKLLASLFGVINHSTVLHILEDVKIETKGDQVSFTTSDLENVLTITTSQLHKEGSSAFCLKASVLKQFLNNALSETLSLNVSKLKDRVAVQNGEFSLSWPIENIDDYPKIPVIDGARIFNIDVKELRSRFMCAIKFASNDDLRPAMTGVCLTDYNNELYVVATDAHRLYFDGIMKTPLDVKYLNIILPKKGVITFLQSFAKGMVEVAISKTHIQFKQENKCLISRLIDARYPDWPQILPNNELEFSMQRKNLLAFLRMAVPFVNRSTNTIILVVNTMGITVSGGDIDFSTEFNYKMPIYNCNLEFAPFRFGVNLKFLMQIAEISNDEYCKFSHAGLPFKSMIIDNHCLLMPLMLNDID